MSEDTRPIVIGQRRVCDLCGKFYIPKTGFHRFCGNRCRMAWNKVGPLLSRLLPALRPIIEAEVEKALSERKQTRSTVAKSEATDRRG